MWRSVDRKTIRDFHDVQKVHPARPQAKSAPEAYPLGYVEDAGETRTKLGGFFNIVLIGEAHDR
jgi:hypothetical protein